jgi:hypothetical protein
MPILCLSCPTIFRCPTGPILPLPPFYLVKFVFTLTVCRLMHILGVHKKLIHVLLGICMFTKPYLSSFLPTDVRVVSWESMLSFSFDWAMAKRFLGAHAESRSVMVVSGICPTESSF